MNHTASAWPNPPPAIHLSRQWIPEGDSGVFRTVARMRGLIRAGGVHPTVRAAAEEAVAYLQHDQSAEVDAVADWIIGRVDYRPDTLRSEWLQEPWWVLGRIQQGERPQLDCIPVDQRVIVRNKATGRYEIIEAGHLQATWSEYQALSYNFAAETWEFRDITAWMPKGVHPVFQVRMLNGTDFRCTADHRLFGWHPNWKQFRPRTLAEVRAAGSRSGAKVSFAMAKHIPALDAVPDRSLDHLWVYGLYVAEGWTQRGSRTPGMMIGGDGELRERLIERLTRLGARWSRSKRERSGHVAVLAGPAKDALLSDVVGHRARFKDLPESFLSMSPPQTDAFLEGYGEGDDFVPTHGTWKDRVQRVHNTSSVELAKKLLFFHRLKGDSASLWTQARHGGAGHFPMYRVLVWRGESSRPRYQERLPGLANASWKSITYHGEQAVCDLSVEGTHNFVLENGVVAHNCDDLTILSLSMLESIGFETTLRVVATQPDRVLDHIAGLVDVNGRLEILDLVPAFSGGRPAPEYRAEMVAV